MTLRNKTALVEVNILTCVIRQGREGEIRHIFRGFAFLHCKKLVENGGMFVCKARHLVLAGGSKVGRFCYICGQILHVSKLPCLKMIPNYLFIYFSPKPRDVTNFTVGGFAPMSPRISSPMHPGGGGKQFHLTHRVL